MGCPFENFIAGSSPKNMSLLDTLKLFGGFFVPIIIYEAIIKEKGVTLLQRILLILLLIFIVFRRFLKILLSDNNPPEYLDNVKMIVNKRDMLIHIAVWICIILMVLYSSECSRNSRILFIILFIINLISVLPVYQTKKLVRDVKGFKNALILGMILLFVFIFIPDCKKWIGWFSLFVGGIGIKAAGI